jgi:hypothetical protein
MTDLASNAGPTVRRLSLPRVAGDPGRQMLALAGLSAALLAMSLAAMLVDPRLLDGSGVWAKPAKFAASFLLYFVTLAWAIGRLGPSMREGRAMRWATVAAAVAFIVEMAWMIWQAGHGAHSHFNLATPLTRAMYSVMGVGAVTLIAVIAVTGEAVRRDHAVAMGPALRAGVVWGFWLSFLLTFVVAGYMSSGTGHHVGTPSAGAAVLPLTGWSAEVGDLRPAHFLALHAMQVLPLAGWWLDRRGSGPAAVRLAGGAYAVVTLAVFAQALMGLPLIRL